MSFETDNWPFKAARWFKDVPPGRKVRVIVIHSMEAPEKGETAENVARYFATTNTHASAHVCIDSDSVVQCVKDSDVAFAAPGANADGIQIELAGYARQKRAEWLDLYGLKMLEKAADVTAQYCLKYDIPVRRLINDQLADGVSKGIVSHAQVSQVFKKSDHMDPGPNFPWDHFIKQVQFHYDRRA